MSYLKRGHFKHDKGVIRVGTAVDAQNKAILIVIGAIACHLSDHQVLPFIKEIFVVASFVFQKKL